MAAKDDLLALLKSGGHAAQEAGYGPVCFGSDGRTYAARTAHALRREGLAELQWGQHDVRSMCWAWVYAGPPDAGVTETGHHTKPPQTPMD